MVLASAGTALAQFANGLGGHTGALGYHAATLVPAGKLGARTAGAIGAWG